MSGNEQIVRAVRTDDGRVLIEQPDGSFRPAQGQTDSARVDRMTEADLEQAIAADPDDPGNDPSYWETTAPLWPRRKEQVTDRRSPCRDHPCRPDSGSRPASRQA